MIKFKMLSQTSSSNSSNRDQTNIYIYLNKIQPSLNTERYGIRPSRRGYQKLNLSISISCIPFRMLNEIINYTQIAHHFFSICQPASQCPYGCWRHCVFAVSPETQHTAVGTNKPWIPVPLPVMYSCKVKGNYNPLSTSLGAKFRQRTSLGGIKSSQMLNAEYLSKDAEGYFPTVWNHRTLDVAHLEQTAEPLNHQPPTATAPCPPVVARTERFG